MSGLPWPWLLAALLGVALGALLYRLGVLQAQRRLLLAEAGVLHLREALDQAEGRADEQSAALRQAELQLAEARAQLVALRTELQQQRRQQLEREQFLKGTRQELGDQFRALAAQVLGERVQALGAQQDERLRELLEPLRTRLGEFSHAVQQSRLEEAGRSGALMRQIDELKTLHQSLSREAVELSRALKGDRRAQGAWGELVLQRVLEASGLREGHEFTTQQVLVAPDGSRPRPDVLVHLPGDRVLIVDAKCSLTAYERAARAADEPARQVALAEHVQSLRRHVEGLGRRDYASLLAGRTPELVLLFVPIESAFLEGLQGDPELLEFALQRGIAFVTPATLLLGLRTVALVWQQDRRNRNAIEIADRAGRLYDKFAGLVEDLARVDDAVQRAARELAGAHGKLREGPGNLLRQVEQLKELGARAAKSLPEA